MSITGSGFDSSLYKYYDLLKFKNPGMGTVGSVGNNAGYHKNSNIAGVETGMQGLPDETEFEAKLRRAMEQKDEKALKEACLGMEELFLNMMYRQMKATIHKSGLIPESVSNDIIQSMFDEALIKEATKSRSIGIADMMYKQLCKQMNNVYKKEITED